MNKVLIALTASLLTVGAYAADDTNKARADVKVEARDANVKGEVAHGEVDPLAMKAQAKLSKEEMVALRSMIKAEAITTNKKAEVGAGEANSLAFTAQAKLTKQEMTAVRSMVKAEAATANKQGTIKAGEKPIQ
jgi:hypothetical protein